MIFDFKSSRLLATTLVLSVVAGAHADGDDHEGEHYDIAVWNDGGVLRTGGWDHDTESLEVANLRVFEATFGEDPELPWSTDEPGLGGVAADLGLTLGSTISLNMASGLGVWNGSGFDYGTSTVFSAEYGPTTIDTITGGSLDFLVTEDYDLHPNWSIAEGTSAGAFAVEMTASIAGLGETESFYMVFNLGLDEEDYEASVEWVEMNLVPAPAALPALGLAFVVGRRRRA